MRSRVPLRYAVVAVIAGLFLVNAVRVVLAGNAAKAAAPAPSAVRGARDLLVDVDQLEVCYHQRHARFSDRLAELMQSSRDAAADPIEGHSPLSAASQQRFAIDLSTSVDGQTYTQRITGNGIDTYVERDARHDFIDYGDLAWNHLKNTCAA
jgi:hypothetical protein